MKQIGRYIIGNNLFSIAILKRLFLFFIVSLFIYSCNENDNLMDSKGGVGENEITFKVTLPGTSSPKIIAKSSQTLLESKIDEIDILVFEDEKFVYKVKGANITNDEQNNRAAFDARLRSFEGEVTLYIVANGSPVLSATASQLLVGISPSDVKALLNESFTSAGVNASMVLWAQYVSASGIANEQSTIQGIKLLRSLARIDVRLSQQASERFKLSTIQAFRAANKLQIVPNNITSTPSVTEPSIPIGAAYNVNTSALSTTSIQTSLSQLYLPESLSADQADLTNATCIVIGGYYNNESELTYYRLDFKPLVEGHPFGQILRNHRYEFKVDQVDRAGYNSASDAASNPSLGMEVSLLSWPNEDIDYMYFNDNSFFGLSDNIVELAGAANSKERIIISTNVADYTIELEPGFFTVEKIGGDVIEFTALQSNPLDGDIRKQTITILADGLQIKVYIVQLSEKALEWATSNVDNFGEFTQDIKDPGKFYQWNRSQSWAIEGAVSGWDVNSINPSAGDKWEGVKNPCPSGWRLPSVEEIGILENQNGFAKMHYGVDETGMWLAASKADVDAATFENPGRAIYFPYAGYRDPKDGSILSLYTIGYYWTNNLMPWGAVPGVISFPSGGRPHVYGIDDRQGCLVRCVK